MPQKGLLPPGGLQRVPRVTKGLPAPKKPKVRPKPKAQVKAKKPPKDPYGADVKAALAQEYGPQFRELESQERISGQQQANVGGWYDDYLRQLGAGQAATAAAYGAAQQGVANQANTAFSQDEAATAALQARANESAAIRGTSAGPNVEGTQAAQSRRALNSSFAGLIGSQGAAATGLGAARMASGAGSKVRALEDEASRGRLVRQKRGELTAERGQKAITLRSELIDKAIQRAAVEKEFGLDVFKAKEDARGDRADRKLARAKAKLDRLDKIADNRRMTASEKRQRAALNETIRHNQQTEANARDDGGGSGGPSNFTPTQVRGGKAQLRNLLSRYKSGKDLPDSHDPLLAKAAIQIAKYGGVTPKLARKIRKEFGFSPRVKKTSPRRTVDQFADDIVPNL